MGRSDRRPWGSTRVLAPSPSIQPTVEPWPAGRPIIRIHSTRFGPTEFNPSRGAQTRFAPIWTDLDEPIPTLYGAATLESAFSETIFHDVVPPGRGPRRVSRLEFRSKVLSYILPLRDLHLARMLGVDLQGLGISHEDLVFSSASEYPWTAGWAEAIYDVDRSAGPSFDGLIWIARQTGDAPAVVLWGGRVRDGHLSPQLDRTQIPLDVGPGLALVESVATRAGILLY